MGFRDLGFRGLGFLVFPFFWGLVVGLEEVFRVSFRGFGVY